MRHGKVKWFSEEKGFGFIELEGCGDILVHFTDVQKSGLRLLNEGQAVAFEVEDDEDEGPHAVNLAEDALDEADAEDTPH